MVIFSIGQYYSTYTDKRQEPATGSCSIVMVSGDHLMDFHLSGKAGLVYPLHMTFNKRSWDGLEGFLCKILYQKTHDRYKKIYTFPLIYLYKKIYTFPFIFVQVKFLERQTFLML